MKKIFYLHKTIYLYSLIFAPNSNDQHTKQMIVSIIGSILFAVIIILYILIFLGKPLGEYAMGGQQKIVSGKTKTMCLIAVIIQLFAVFVLLEGGGIINTGFPLKATKIICYIFAAYFSLNVVMNLFSKSKKEKAVMTPLSAIVAGCFWITAFSI